MSTTFTFCDHCKGSCSELDRFCPSCGSNQQQALSEFNVNQPPTHSRCSGNLLFETPPASPKPIANHVGYSTHLNVAPNNGPAVIPGPQTINVNVAQPNVQPYYQPQEEDYTFAILTLLAYIFVFPFGALMNLIGLICGPRRGCFAAMFFLILVPTVCLGMGLIAFSLIAGAAGP